jgi:hypothetical protein
MVPVLDERSKMLSKYQVMMSEIMYRSDVITSIMSGTVRNGYKDFDYEILAINFRKIAELIVYANLVSHEKEYASVHPKYIYEWRMANIISKIKAINPNCYPKAARQGPIVQGVRQTEDVPPGEWMTEDELIEMYDLCSDLIHARNPFQPRVNISDYDERFSIWYSKIVNLLNHHIVQLADSRYSVWCIMNPEGTRKPKAYWFELVGNSKPE